MEFVSLLILYFYFLSLVYPIDVQSYKNIKHDLYILYSIKNLMICWFFLFDRLLLCTVKYMYWNRQSKYQVDEKLKIDNILISSISKNRQRS